MRITNQMVSGSSMRNMQKSMGRVNKLTEQMSTGKKIQAPSEDPVIAIRALKLRTTVDQLDQYKNKNIPDAMSWMDTTQTSIQNVMDRLQDVYFYCVEGATDSFSTPDRYTIINNLRAIKEAIYSEGGTTYAGRYLFSGYKTETNLIFQDMDSKAGLSYEITQKFSGSDIEVKNVVLNPINPDDIDDILTAGGLAGGTYINPTASSAYKMRLAYNDLDGVIPTISIGTPPVAYAVTPVQKSLSDLDCYDPGDNDIFFIPETGELIFGKDVYNDLKQETDITVEYEKSRFNVGDLRPEMYFDCVRHALQKDGSIQTINFTVNEAGQEIQYEVNFNQMITVNVEGREIIQHDMGNRIEDLAIAVQEMLDAESTIAKLKRLLDDPQYKNDDDAVELINTMLEDAEVELAIRRENMQKLFGNNITNFQVFGEEVGSVQAKVATNFAKLEMIQERVKEQLTNFKELRSVNEDVETEEAAIDLYSAELVYQASLITTSSVMQKTLLDYL